LANLPAIGANRLNRVFQAATGVFPHLSFASPKIIHIGRPAAATLGSPASRRAARNPWSPAVADGKNAATGWRRKEWPLAPKPPPAGHGCIFVL
jgi:hypothetical protein